MIICLCTVPSMDGFPGENDDPGKKIFETSRIEISIFNLKHDFISISSFSLEKSTMLGTVQKEMIETKAKRVSTRLDENSWVSLKWQPHRYGGARLCNADEVKRSQSNWRTFQM